MELVELGIHVVGCLACCFSLLFSILLIVVGDRALFLFYSFSLSLSLYLSIEIMVFSLFDN